jgi:hypothetical protein
MPYESDNWDGAKVVNIEVYGDNFPHKDIDKEVFGVLSHHPPDLPPMFDSELQKWVTDTFHCRLDVGDELAEAGEMVYTESEILEFREK